MENICSNLPVLANAHDIDLVRYINKEYVVGEILGEKLGSNKPRQYINNLYNRHKNEFKEDESIVIKLMTMIGATKKKKAHVWTTETRLFSVPNGAFRLCMLSNAPNRVDVHNEILDLFDTFRFGAMLCNLPANQPAAITEWYIRELQKRFGKNTGNKIFKQLLDGSFDARERFVPMGEMARLPSGFAVSSAVGKYCKDKGVCRNTGYRHLDKQRQAMGIPKPNTKLTGKPKKTRSDKGVHKSPDYQKVMEYHEANPKAMGKEIKAAMGLTVSSATINRWIRESMFH